MGGSGQCDGEGAGYCSMCCRMLGNFLQPSSDTTVSLINTEEKLSYMGYQNEEFST